MAKRKSSFLSDATASNLAGKGGATLVRPPAAAKAKKGGAETVDTSKPLNEKSTPTSNQREKLTQELADVVSRLSEQVDKAEATLNRAKESLKQERQNFNKLSQKLRTETKLLADLTAGRPIPRDLYSELE